MFSHPSKVDLVQRAARAGHQVELHVVLIPEDLAVARVGDRVARGGHRVPESKIRERYQRLWPLVSAAVPIAHRATFYDNSRGRNPFRTVAMYGRGRPVLTQWPTWAPPELLAALPPGRVA